MAEAALFRAGIDSLVKGKRLKKESDIMSNVGATIVLEARIN